MAEDKDKDNEIGKDQATSADNMFVDPDGEVITEFDIDNLSPDAMKEIEAAGRQADAKSATQPSATHESKLPTAQSASGPTTRFFIQAKEHDLTLADWIYIAQHIGDDPEKVKELAPSLQRRSIRLKAYEEVTPHLKEKAAALIICLGSLKVLRTDTKEPLLLIKKVNVFPLTAQFPHKLVAGENGAVIVPLPISFMGKLFEKITSGVMVPVCLDQSDIKKYLGGNTAEIESLRQENQRLKADYEQLQSNFSRLKNSYDGLQERWNKFFKKVRGAAKLIVDAIHEEGTTQQKK